MFLKKNCCDGIYRSLDVHFTKKCDNNCAFCVDKDSMEFNNGNPNWEKIADSIIARAKDFDDVLILGGEPCLFLDSLTRLVAALKKFTSLKVYCTSSMPVTCHKNRNLFFELLEMLDGFNLSAQHSDEMKADEIRGCKSSYDRQAFYAALPFKEKIRINLNIVRGSLDTKESIITCLRHYDRMVFNSMKLSEIQHATNSFISFENIFGVKMGSPYSSGCQAWIDTEQTLGVKIDTPILLKRSCFICEESLKASVLDGLKVLIKLALNKPMMDNTNYGIVYEDGSIAKGWLKNKGVK